MPPVGFEPTISVGERLETYTLERAATGTGLIIIRVSKWIDEIGVSRATRVGNEICKYNYSLKTLTAETIVSIQV